MIQHLEFTQKVKKNIFEMINKNQHDFFPDLEKLLDKDLDQETVTEIIENFLVKLYKGSLKTRSTTLNELRYDLYLKTIGKSKLTVDFELKNLPPTSGAARQHALRAYHSIQQWKGVSLNPLDWGWYLKNSVLKPIYTECQTIPDKLADMISCGCTKGNCGDDRCICKINAIKCSIVCNNCNGIDCNNSRTAED